MEQNYEKNNENTNNKFADQAAEENTFNDQEIVKDQDDNASRMENMALVDDVHNTAGGSETDSAMKRDGDSDIGAQIHGIPTTDEDDKTKREPVNDNVDEIRTKMIENIRNEENEEGRKSQ